MSEVIITTYRLKDGHTASTLWQEAPNGFPEQALQIRTHDSMEDNLPLIEIKQLDHEITINGESVPELIKLLKHLIKP